MTVTDVILAATTGGFIYRATNRISRLSGWTLDHLTIDESRTQRHKGTKEFFVPLCESIPFPAGRLAGCGLCTGGSTASQPIKLESDPGREIVTTIPASPHRPPFSAVPTQPSSAPGR